MIGKGKADGYIGVGGCEIATEIEESGFVEA